LDELHVLDGLEEEKALFVEERTTVISDLARATLLEEMSWRQESRALWLKEGDKCTKFFYSVANSNRRNNSIESPLVNGSISSNQTEIRDHNAILC
jgi:hypothetical protein